jgi:hypothetical protein
MMRGRRVGALIGKRDQTRLQCVSIDISSCLLNEPVVENSRAPLSPSSWSNFCSKFRTLFGRRIRRWRGRRRTHQRGERRKPGSSRSTATTPPSVNFPIPASQPAPPPSYHPQNPYPYNHPTNYYPYYALNHPLSRKMDTHTHTNSIDFNSIINIIKDADILRVLLGQIHIQLSVLSSFPVHHIFIFLCIFYHITTCMIFYCPLYLYLQGSLSCC